jgi:hypothetical protein
VTLSILNRARSLLGLPPKSKSTAQLPKTQKAPVRTPKLTLDEMRDLFERYDISPTPIEEGDPPSLRRLLASS